MVRWRGGRVVARCRGGGGSGEEVGWCGGEEARRRGGEEATATHTCIHTHAYTHTHATHTRAHTHTDMHFSLYFLSSPPRTQRDHSLGDHICAFDELGIDPDGSSRQRTLGVHEPVGA